MHQPEDEENYVSTSTDTTYNPYSTTKCTKSDYKSLHKQLKKVKVESYTKFDWCEEDFPKLCTPTRIGIFGPSYCGNTTHTLILYVYIYIYNIIS